MVRLTIGFYLLAVGFPVAAEAQLLQAEYRGEAKIMHNYALAIATFYNANGKMPRALEEIRDNAVLTLDFSSSHAATVPSRYALLEAPIDLPEYGKAAMVSVDYFVSDEDVKEKRMGGRMVALLRADGSAGSARVPASIIDPILKAANVTLKPIGGEVPAPTFPLTPRKPEMSETMKRALEMQARGELPTPPRRDKETWRDEKPPALPASTPTPAPVAPPSAKSSNPLWWIVGAVAALAAVVFIARRKKPKA